MRITNSTKGACFLAVCTTLLGCSHQETYRYIDSASKEFAVHHAVDKLYGNSGLITFFGVAILNKMFMPSPDANASCINGLGQVVDCNSMEPIKENSDRSASDGLEDTVVE